MKRRIIILALICNTLFAWAQEGFVDGYIITNSNQKIYGKIRDRKRPYSVNSWQKILFIDSNGAKDKYKPDDIKGYVKNDTIVYQTLALGIEERKTFVAKIEDGPVILFADMKDALPQNVGVSPSPTGAGVYVYINFGPKKKQITGEFYLQAQNDPRTLMMWRERDYIMTSKYFFRENKELVKQIESGKYGYSDVQTIVRIYNEWKIRQ